MALQKQGIQVSFGQGLDTKTDPSQVPLGKMIALENVTFDNMGSLKKRSGFRQITALPETASSLSTFNGGLVGIGQSLQVYSAPNDQWLNKGSLPAIDLRVSQVGRTGASQLTSDMTMAANGLTCVVYQDSTGSYYQVVDISNNEVILAPVLISATATRPRAFLLSSWFIVTFIDTITATPHLRFIAVPLGNVTSPNAAADISTSIKANPTGYDGVVANNQLYLAWNGADVGDAIRVSRMTNQLVIASPTVYATYPGTAISVTADISGSTPNIWVMFYDSGATTTKVVCLGATLATLLGPTAVSADAITQVTGYATGGRLTMYQQVVNAYGYDSGIQTNYIRTTTVTTGGTVGTPTTILRGMGIASKVFVEDGVQYILGVYGQASTTLQPSYFLINSSGSLVSKLAYSNGAGYLSTSVLSNVIPYSGSYYLSYLFRDQIVPVNKTQGQTGAVTGIYSQNGVNIAAFTFGAPQFTAEIGGALHVTGGLLWMYDGSTAVEHGFNVWPENLKVTTSTSGGSVTDQLYYYQFCYEWTDLKGNIHRSAPSIPVAITAAGGNTSTNTVNVPTLRLTNKTNVRLVGYRWSTAQPVFYQFTSITSPSLNNKAVDYLAIADTLADSSILGNSILYTTGGVLENIGAPACSALTLYKSRLLLLTSEDRNLIWASKQVIEGTPVELTDLLTFYVAPTIASQSSTGNITALSSMDDKIILFKESAAYYVTGQGPDNTGANNDFTDPVFINSTVGCTNQSSIVFSPNGLMFQTNKGIYLLGRDLSTPYIGADVQGFNVGTVESALSIPTTTQVRFTLSTGITLMYDYYYNQWGTFTGIPGVSSTTYQNLHTYVDANNRVFQENPGHYLDGSRPVNMSFTSAWFKLTDLQGFQRAYFLFLIGEYLSPHKLNVQLAYDYDPSIVQSSLITPINFSPAYGGDSLWGSGSVYGGPSSVEQWQIYMEKQKCQAIQIKVDEVFDSSLGITAGAGLVLSGLNMVIGAKAGYPKLPAAVRIG